MCPFDEYASNGTLCRVAVGPCDAAESCTDSSIHCPADQFMQIGNVCRASAGICDLAEICTGSGPDCPVDDFQPDTTKCGTVPIAEEFACSNEDCGGDAVYRTQYQYCSGTSVSCDQSNLIWEDWLVLEDCGLEALCETDGSFANCMTCEQGCSNGSCNDGLPPDPSLVATELIQTGVVPFYESVEFLFTGSNPIQTGVVSGTINPERVAVLKGKVENRDGSPLPGATITIKDHPEFGQTISRADGYFDIVVNGGGIITVNYGKDQRLSAHRSVTVPWREYVWIENVVMIPLDNQVTLIDLTSPQYMQLARGSVVVDDDGSRQSTLLFPLGTEAEMVFEDSSAQSISTLNVRATEYTVGESGPRAMPAELPPTSGYTHCVELSADEVINSGAIQLRFNQPVLYYVEDYIGFPIGSAVPVGFYDRQKAEWIPSDNGRVIKILGINSGMADLDTTGDELADNGADLNMTIAERMQLANLHPVGQVLWRVPVMHFSPIDCNWPRIPPKPPSKKKRPKKKKNDGDGDDDGDGDPEKEDDEDDCKDASGSFINCQSRYLGERVPIVGTPYLLNYRSKRVKGNQTATTFEIPLTEDDVHPLLQNIHVKIEIEGQIQYKVFPPEPNQVYEYAWNGRDGYGRAISGKRPYKISVGYEYPFIYGSVGRENYRAFARGFVLKNT